MTDGVFDVRDQDLDGVEDADSLEDQADVNRPYGEVTAGDLSAQDLIDDGADLAASLDDSSSEAGLAPVDVEIEMERDQAETIEDRILQEEPDPTSSIVPPDAAR